MHEKLSISFSIGSDGVGGSILTRRAAEHLGEVDLSQRGTKELKTAQSPALPWKWSTKKRSLSLHRTLLEAEDSPSEPLRTMKSLFYKGSGQLRS